MADAPTPPPASPATKTSNWKVFFHWLAHSPRAHLGANTISILAGILLGGWMIHMFWVSSNTTPTMRVLWYVTIYLVIEPTTAALTVIRKDRWATPIFDILVGFLLALVASFAIYDQSALELAGSKLEIAYLMLFMTWGALVASLVITMIVNTRMIGVGPSGTPA